MKFHRVIWIVLLFVLDCVLFVGLRIQQGEEIVTTSGGGMSVSDVFVKEPAISGNTTFKGKIALTFDDGPNHKYTPLLLEGLKERNVRATFFLLGHRAVENPELVKQIAEDGHLIGNHSFYHDDLSKLSSEEAVNQVNRTNDVIYELTGKYPKLLRPPFGCKNSEIVYDPPMREVLWTIDSRDWALSDVGEIMQNVLPEAKENAIILMHDASTSSVQAALAIVDSLQQEGYSFVTLDEILYDRH
ncbi:MAG: polysaccharide deacetylase family protein [Lachnospiraceae bacterium]|nr:polysaccharide deacetylase family protein [Lachnospiraceae bacterium]